MLSHPQLQIAGQILIGLMCRGRSRELSDRVIDVRHALEVSAELIRQWEGEHRSKCDYTPPSPAVAAKTREALVDRAFVSTEQWRQKRTSKQTSEPTTRKPRPTVH